MTYSMKTHVSRYQQGVSLVELMIAMVLSLILGAAVITVFANNRHAFNQDENVSRMHAEIRYEEDSFRIHDLGSANGVLLNGERVSAAPLENGDVVRIGDYELFVTIPSDQADGARGSETGNMATIHVEPPSRS